MDKFKAVQILTEYIQKTKLIEFQSNIYLFGSIMQSTKDISDVDLLITYEDTKELQQIKNEIHVLEHRLPIDVIYMNIEEEKELDFIVTQRAMVYSKWPNNAINSDS